MTSLTQIARRAYDRAVDDLFDARDAGKISRVDASAKFQALTAAYQTSRLKSSHPLLGVREMTTTYETLRKLARKNPPKTDGMTREQLEAAVRGITEELRGPGVSTGERIALNEDRHVYRAALAAIEAAS